MLLRYVRLMARAIRRLSVTLLQPTQSFELLSNIFTKSNSVGSQRVCVIILGKQEVKVI